MIPRNRFHKAGNRFLGSLKTLQRELKAESLFFCSINYCVLNRGDPSLNAGVYSMNKTGGGVKPFLIPCFGANSVYNYGPSPSVPPPPSARPFVLLHYQLVPFFCCRTHVKEMKAHEFCMNFVMKQSTQIFATVFAFITLT